MSRKNLWRVCPLFTVKFQYFLGNRFSRIFSSRCFENCLFSLYLEELFWLRFLPKTVTPLIRSKITIVHNQTNSPQTLLQHCGELIGSSITHWDSSSNYHHLRARLNTTSCALILLFGFSLLIIIKYRIKYTYTTPKYNCFHACQLKLEISRTIG